VSVKTGSGHLPLPEGVVKVIVALLPLFFLFERSAEKITHNAFFSLAMGWEGEGSSPFSWPDGEKRSNLPRNLRRLVFETWEIFFLLPSYLMRWVCLGSWRRRVNLFQRKSLLLSFRGSSHSSVSLRWPSPSH